VTRRSFGILTLLKCISEIPVYIINRKLDCSLLRFKYYLDTIIIDPKYGPASFDNVIKIYENFHEEEQHQLKKLLQKFELPYPFDGKLENFSME
jgi:hypothetical protein